MKTKKAIRKPTPQSVTHKACSFKKLPTSVLAREGLPSASTSFVAASSANGSFIILAKGFSSGVGTLSLSVVGGVLVFGGAKPFFIFSGRLKSSLGLVGLGMEPKLDSF